MRLDEVGERRSIDRIWKIIGHTEIYDDCVYIKEENLYKLYTTDFIGENIHFMRDWDPEIIGRFFVSINLSDIAAMGGVPEFFMAAMSFPRDVKIEFVEGLLKGMKSVFDEFNVEYRGGDFKEALSIGMSGFVVGYVEEDRIMRRDTLKPDDKVYITGELGKQAAGYILWKNGVEEGINYLLGVYPRIREAREISKMASACMDLSDGLLSSIKFLGNDKYGIKIDFEKLPVSKLAYEVSEDYSIPLEFLITMFGGEYELVYTSPKGVFGKEVGFVERRSEAGIWKNGKRIRGEGYVHFGQILDKA